jgi:hypothetical protein
MDLILCHIRRYHRIHIQGGNNRSADIPGRPETIDRTEIALFVNIQSEHPHNGTTGGILPGTYFPDQKLPGAVKNDMMA